MSPKRVAGLTLALACSSSSGGATDGAGGAAGKDGGGSEAQIGGACDFAACGGDPIGDWRFDKICVETTPLRPSCPTSTFQQDLFATGTYSLAADKTYTLQFIQSGSATSKLPASCLATSETCADLERSLQPTLPQTTCSSYAGGCLCHTPYSDATGTGRGTWSVSGTKLTLTPMGMPAATVDFCASAKTFSTHQDGAKPGDPGATFTYLRN